MRFYTIYQITNTINGKIYIGCHQTDDLADSYLGSGTAITRAVKKYGRDAFVKTILHIFDEPEEMYSMEAEIVNEDFLARRDTYNLALGGVPNSIGIEHWSEDRREKHRLDCERFSERMKNNTLWVGRKHAESTRAKISAKAKDRTGDLNSSFGRKWVYNEDLRQSMKVAPEDIGDLTATGWKLGRVVDWDKFFLPKPVRVAEPRVAKQKEKKEPIPYSERNLARKVSDEDYIAALQAHPSICQALTSLGLAPKGKNYTRAKRLLGYDEGVKLSTNGKILPA